jgi:hypothetical protein
MIVVRLTSGKLWVNSPVEATAPDLEMLRAWGEIGFLVSPTRLHVWRLEPWMRLAPQAEVWLPPQIPRSFRHLRHTGILGDEPPRAWSDDFAQVVFRGNILLEEVFFFHRASRTLILADFIQNYPPVAGHPLQNALKKMAGVAAPDGGVPLDIRLSFLHRRAARRSLAQVLAWDFANLVIAHGTCVHTIGREMFERAFAWL